MVIGHEIVVTGGSARFEPRVAGALVAVTRNVRAMTHAKVKSDRIDARMIAKLLAAGMLPGVWIWTRPPVCCVAGSRGERSLCVAVPRARN